MFAKGSVNTPTCHAASRYCDMLLIDLSARNGLTFSTASVLQVLQEIMTETGIWGRHRNEACGRFLRVDSEVISEVISEVLNSVEQGPELSKTGS